MILDSSSIGTRVTRRRRYLWLFAALTLTGIALWFGLLHGERPPQSVPSGTSDVQRIDGEPLAVRPDWLTPLSVIDAARWLAEWPGEAGSAPQRQAAEARKLLAAARDRFNDDPRMIANRSAQMAEMLREIGSAEHPLDVLRDLLSVRGPESRAVPFAELCQHYFNFRQRGIERRAALDALTTEYRYGEAR